MSSVDESMLTGEPVPVQKRPARALIGGTTQWRGGCAFARITARGSETCWRRFPVAARGSRLRAPIQRLADRVSGVFVPVVVARR